ncbi:MAG: energy transducer TonB [Bacteroidota bacterium]
MLLITTALFIFLSIDGFAQKKIYLDKLRQPTDKKSAVFVKKYSKENDNLFYRIYRLAGNKLLFEAQLSSINPEVKEGTVKEWNNQGVLITSGNFSSNKKSGEWKTYYSNKRLETIYSVKDEVNYYHQIWNKYAKPQLAQGNGMVISKLKGYTDHLIAEYKDSIQYKTYFVDEQLDTVYYKPQGKAMFKHGREQLYNFLGNAVKYPVNARKLGVSGNVHLRFQINRDGAISKIVVTNGLGLGCDQEAIRVISLTSGQWLPAQFNGNPVHSIVELPVRFLMLKRGG